MRIQGTSRPDALWRMQCIADAPADGDWQLLSDRERTRALAIAHPAARTRFVVARALLRRTVAEARPGTAGPDLDVAVAPTGRLFVAGQRDLHVSSSHTRGLAVAATSTVGALGIDVESLARRDLPPVEPWLTAGERRTLDGAAPADRGTRLLEWWVAKEAVMKACDRCGPVTRRGIEVRRGRSSRATPAGPGARPQVVSMPPADAGVSVVMAGRGTASVTFPSSGGEPGRTTASVAWYRVRRDFLVAIASTVSAATPGGSSSGPILRGADDPG